MVFFIYVCYELMKEIVALLFPLDFSQIIGRWIALFFLLIIFPLIRMFVCFVVFLVEKIKSKRVLSTYYPNEDHLSDLQQDQNIDSQSEEEVFETLD